MILRAIAGASSSARVASMPVDLDIVLALTLKFSKSERSIRRPDGLIKTARKAFLLLLQALRQFLQLHNHQCTRHEGRRQLRSSTSIYSIHSPIPTASFSRTTIYQNQNSLDLHRTQFIHVSVPLRCNMQGFATFWKCPSAPLCCMRGGGTAHGRHTYSRQSTRLSYSTKHIEE
jgi:hypothetical protein